MGVPVVVLPPCYVILMIILIKVISNLGSHIRFIVTKFIQIYTVWQKCFYLISLLQLVCVSFSLLKLTLKL